MSDDLRQHLHCLNGQIDQLIQQSRQISCQQSRQQSINGILITLLIIIIIQLNSIGLINNEKYKTYSDGNMHNVNISDHEQKEEQLFVYQSTASHEKNDLVNNSNHLTPKIPIAKYPNFEYKNGHQANTWSPTFFFKTTNGCGFIQSDDNFKTLTLGISKYQEPFSIKINPEQMTFSSFSNDCKYNFRLIGTEVMIFSVANKQYHHQTTLSYGSKQSPLVAKLSQDRYYLFVGGSDFKIQVWDFINNKKLAELSGHYGYVTDFIYVPKYNILLSSGEDSKIIQWDINIWKCTQVISAHSNIIKQLYLSNDQNYLVSVSADQSMKIWQLPKLQLMQEIKIYIKPINTFFYPQEEHWSFHNGTHHLDIDVSKHIQAIKEKQD